MHQVLLLVKQVLLPPLALAHLQHTTRRTLSEYEYNVVYTCEGVGLQSGPPAQPAGKERGPVLTCVAYTSMSACTSAIRCSTCGREKILDKADCTVYKGTAGVVGGTLANKAECIVYKGPDGVVGGHSPSSS